MKRACEDTLEEPDDKIKQKKLEFDDQQNDVGVDAKEVNEQRETHPQVDTAQDTTNCSTEKDPEVKKPENPCEVMSTSSKVQDDCNSNKIEANSHETEFMTIDQDPEEKKAENQTEVISTSSKDQVDVNSNEIAANSHETEVINIHQDPDSLHSQNSYLSLSSEDQSMSNGRFKSEINNNQTKDNQDDLNPSKRQRWGKDEEIRMLIPSQIAGAVIGKRGGNIQKLRTDYNAKVNIVDCRGPERVVTISANMDTCCDVIREIMKYFEAANENELDLRILIHQSVAGCVIGKSGAKIKEIKDRIGCKLKIFPQPAPQSTDRVVQIVGNEIQCIQTVMEIYDLIRGHLRGQIHLYDPHNFDEYYAESYGGFGVVGKILPRHNVRDRNRVSSRRVNTPRYNRNARPYDYVNPWAATNNTGHQAYSNNGHMSQMNHNGYGQVMEERTTTQVSIPRDMAGALIGKRGERIKRIREESRAAIHIDESQRGTTDRIISITGTQSQIQTAQYMLQQCIRDGVKSSHDQVQIY